MLLPRRISEKKCRFTAKKITFLEYQRVKRFELTKNITERKRLGNVLFLPEVADEGNSLSHESIQRILHQGSLFHSVKTNSNYLDDYNNNIYFNGSNATSLCNIRENNLKDSIKGSLDDLLYGRILNVRCLNNHDLCILLSYLINASEFSEVKCSLLLKVLEQIIMKFDTLSISEISHILYNISKLNRLTNSYKKFMELSCLIISRTTRLLYDVNKLKDINFISSSNISKILYTLTHWDVLDLKLNFKELLKVYVKYLDPNKPNSRDYSLICKSMIRLKCPDYELLKVISEYYYHQILQFNINVFNQCSNTSNTGSNSSSTGKTSTTTQNNNMNGLDKKEDYNNKINNNINNNLNMLYCFDRIDEKIYLDDLFVFLETNEYFGVNHSNLLNEFDQYISNYLSIFTSNTGILKNMYNWSNITTKNTTNLTTTGTSLSTTNKSVGNSSSASLSTSTANSTFSSRKKKRLINLLKNDNYLRNNKLDLQKIYSELCKIDGNKDHLWNLEEIKKIEKYVNKRHLFKKYVNAIGIDTTGNTANNAATGNNSTGKEVGNASSANLSENTASENRSYENVESDQKEELIKGFMESIEYLPKIINFNNIWKIFKVINESNRIDLVPMFYSYLSECSIVFSDLEEPSDDLSEIFRKIVEKKSENYLVEIDNISKIVQIFCENDLKKDYIGIKMFCNMFKILMVTNRISSEEFQELNSCGSLSFVKEILGEYFEKFLKIKVLEFESVPSRSTSNEMVGLILENKKCKNIDDMMLILEEFRRLDGLIDKVVESNVDVFKFVIYNGFIGRMEEENKLKLIDLN